MNEQRKLLLEIVQRYRESLAAVKSVGRPLNNMAEGYKAYWLGRAEAYNEVYTELKGRFGQ